MAAPPSTEEREAWEAAVTKAIVENDQLVSTMEDTLRAQDELLKAVADLPSKTQHPVMVPFGSVAFMPGYLTHTNELMVHLGSKTYVERTAAQTLGILERRKQLLEDETAVCRNRLETLRKRLEVGSTVMVTEDGLLDIREDYDPTIHESSPAAEPIPSPGSQSHAKKQSAKPQGSDADDTELARRMEELIRLEAQSGELLEPLKDPSPVTPSTTVEGLPPGLTLGSVSGKATWKEDDVDSDDDPDFDGNAAPAGAHGQLKHRIVPGGEKKGIVKNPSSPARTMSIQADPGEGTTGVQAGGSSTSAVTSIVGEVVERLPSSCTPHVPGDDLQAQSSATGQEQTARRPSRFKAMRRHLA